MRLIQRVKCVFGDHHRRRGLVRDDATGRHSRCSGCGRRMVKRGTLWQVDRKAG